MTFWKLKEPYAAREFYIFQNGVQPWIMFPNEKESCPLEAICKKEILHDRGDDVVVSE